MADRMPRRALLDDRLLLALLLGAAAGLYLAFFNILAVPNPDFFDYRGHALRYLHGVMPESFKRMPVFPLLIGVVSLVMPGQEPELMAALSLNILLGVVSVWLIWRIACELVTPWAALAVAALCAVNRATVFSVAEAMQELTILTALLLVVRLALRQSPWAYVAAFVASLTRFELVFLIPLLVLQDRLTTTGARRARAVWWGALASVGIIGWMALSLQARESAYLSEALARPSEGVAFLKGCLRVPWNFLPGHLFGITLIRRAVLLTTAALLGAGAAILMRRHRSRMTLILGGLATYAAVHVAFPAHVERYLVPILWILYLLMAVAVECLLARAPSWWRVPARWLAGLLLLAVLGAGLSSAISHMTSDRIRLHRIQFRRVGEWYRLAARPGDRMAVQFRSTVRYYSRLPRDYFLPMKALESDTPDALVEEMRAKGLTHVVWDNNPDPTGFYTKWHRTWLMTLVKARPPAALEPVLHINEAGKQAVVYRLRPTATEPGTP